MGEGANKLIPHGTVGAPSLTTDRRLISRQTAIDSQDHHTVGAPSLTADGRLTSTHRKAGRSERARCQAQSNAGEQTQRDGGFGSPGGEVARGYREVRLVDLVYLDIGDLNSPNSPNSPRVEGTERNIGRRIERERERVSRRQAHTCTAGGRESGKERNKRTVSGRQDNHREF